MSKFFVGQQGVKCNNAKVVILKIDAPGFYPIVGYLDHGDFHGADPHAWTLEGKHSYLPNMDLELPPITKSFTRDEVAAVVKKSADRFMSNHWSQLVADWAADVLFDKEKA
jgi:hypothetical protein